MDVDSPQMEKFRMKLRQTHFTGTLVTLFVAGLMAAAVTLATTGCASRFLQFENSEQVLENKEFDQAIKVKELATPTPTPSPEEVPVLTDPATRRPTPPPTATPLLNPTPKPKPTPKSKSGKSPVKEDGPKPREPSFEDNEGFGVGSRRPLIDPFNVGEEVVLDISYFGVDAGELTMQVRPFVEVNGRKAYRFHSIAKTVSVFEMFYKVDDYAETLVDFETLRPFSYTLNVKESKLLRSARALHDWDKGMMFFWDKKITKEHGVEEKKQGWEMPAFSQNIFSSLWYLRVFQLTPGKKIQFRMTHENENLLITCEVLRREVLDTKIGKLQTIVIRPSAEKDGEKKNIGDNLFWLTDDENKLMVRMESKIKLGTIVGSLNRLKRR
jgi:hypothetical protein